MPLLEPSGAYGHFRPLRQVSAFLSKRLSLLTAVVFFLAPGRSERNGRESPRGRPPSHEAMEAHHMAIIEA